MSTSLWRDLLYTAIKTLTLNGDVLDLGGSHNSRYHKFFKGSPRMLVANLELGEQNEYTFDFEEPFPVADELFDGVVCLNVLEHIFNYQNVLRESHRILRPGGSFVLAVPFMMQLHPSPHDHWRFSKETLERLLREAGFIDIEVRTIGTGVFGASYQLFHNLYRVSIVQKVCRVFAILNDRIVSALKRNSFFSKEYYPLGYLIIAKK